MSSPLQHPDPGNPYAAPTARIVDLEAQPAGEPASRGIRLGAAIIDMLVFVGPILLVFLLSASLGTRSPTANASLVFVPAAVGLILLGLLLYNLILVIRFQQSIGKHFCKIKIVRSDGSRCEAWRIIFLRGAVTWVLSQIPLLGMLFSLLDPLLIFRDDQRCIHDHIAGTTVVRA